MHIQSRPGPAQDVHRTLCKRFFMFEQTGEKNQIRTPAKIALQDFKRIAKMLGKQTLLNSRMVSPGDKPPWDGSEKKLRLQPGIPDMAVIRILATK